MLPNLIVIGASKAGTTSFHYYLDQHPEISMSEPKEPHFFGREDWREHLEWYESLFRADTPIRGESSVSYAMYPVKVEVPERIRELIPDAKLVYLVRDPVDRFVAHYGQHLGNGKETRSLERVVTESLHNGDDPRNAYLTGSSYGTQVEQVLGHFPPSQLLVIDQVDLKEDRLGTLRSAFRFLGVDDTYDTPRFHRVLNTRRDQVSWSRLGGRLRFSGAAAAVRRHVPRDIRRPVTKPLTRLMSRRVNRPELTPEQGDALRERLAPEVERLRVLTGQHFDRWSV
ncbi:MAG: sulfotransferase family protein [Solirubrobacterales bacterium]